MTNPKRLMTEKNGAKPKRNNYFCKPRRNVSMWVIYTKLTGAHYYFPRADVHGQITAYQSKSSAAADLYEARSHGQAYLQRVGPIS